MLSGNEDPFTKDINGRSGFNDDPGYQSLLPWKNNDIIEVEFMLCTPGNNVESPTAEVRSGANIRSIKGSEGKLIVVSCHYLLLNLILIDQNA